MLKLRRNRLHQPGAEVPHVGFHLTVAHERQLLLDFARSIAPHLHIVCGRVLVGRRRDVRLRENETDG